MINNLCSLKYITNRIDELEKIGKYAYNRVLMEKEKQKLTYDDLSKMLQVSFGIKIDSENLRKKLNSGRKIDPELLKELYAVLGIQNELDNNEAVAVYHYTKNKTTHIGQPSEVDRAEQQKLYNEAQQRKSDPDKGEYSIDELFLNFADSGEESEYYELEKEHLREINFLKRALLIYREFPQAFDDLFSTITFEEQDEEKLKRLEIEFHEH